MTNETVVNFGCRLNSYESEVIKNILKKKDLKDVVVFNTCSVTNEAERQTVQAIRKHKRENPDIEIIVTGCAAQVNPRKYLEMPEVARVINNKEKLLAKSYVTQEEKSKGEELSHADYDAETEFISELEGRTRALVPIQNGCDHNCTFCIVTYIRGPSRSTPIEKILKQVKLFVKQGYREVVLTGINITSYGKDLREEINLGGVVKRILREEPSLARLRLSSVDVAEIDDDLLEVIATEKRFMPHLHLSLQSGDNEVLSKMKRRHTREQAQKICRDVRAARADVTFGADIITGFPTETEEQFGNSCALVEEIKIPFLHVFPYSERYNTAAARMPQLDKKIRKDRAKILRVIGKENLEELSKNFVGREVEILLEKNNTGRMENFLKVILTPNNFEAGELIKVRITKYKDGNLIGEAIE
jgi:threonylcarbamoyladenosine tRNA methylthiotransferase MtaB